MFISRIKDAVTRLLVAALALVVLSFAIAAPAEALSLDPTKIIPGRQFQWQMTHYCRVTINYNDPRIGSTTASPQFCTVPNNAYILTMDAYVVTAFNAGTTNVVTIGSTATSANEMSAAGTIAPATLGVQHLTTAAGLGLAVTSNTTYQTSNGVPLYARYTQTGTAATAGQVVVIIAYVPNNDN